MATTFGNRPEDVVADSRGNVLSGVVLQIYPTEADATNETALIGQATSDAQGSWPYTDTGSRSLLWVRDPNGRVWPVASEEAIASVADKADAAATTAALALKAPLTGSTVYAPIADPIAPLVTKLDQRQSAASLVLLGDSTGVPPTTGTWVGDLATLIGAEWKSCKVTTRLQSAAVYPAPTTVSTGVITRTVAQDTFTRTVADLVGSTPDVGGVWTGTAGKYSINGTQALFANVAAGSSNRIAFTALGRISTTVNLSLSYTAGSTPAGQIQVLSSYIDGSNFLWVQLDNNTAVITYKVSTTAGGTVNVSTSTYAAAGITAQAPNRAVQIKIEHIADTVVYTVGTATYTHNLSAPESAAFAAGTAVGFWGGTNNHAVEDITATVSSPAATTLDIYNGSASSTDATWPNGAVGRLAALIPVTPDAVFISYGHNHTTESPTTLQGHIDTLVTAIRALYASVPIVIVSQNHQKSPATNMTYHNAREAAKRAWAKARGYGYLPVYEAFMGQDFPDDFIQSDGVHPTTSGTADGGAIWAAAAQAYLTANSNAPA